MTKLNQVGPGQELSWSVLTQIWPSSTKSTSDEISLFRSSKSQLKFDRIQLSPTGSKFGRNQSSWHYWNLAESDLAKIKSYIPESTLVEIWPNPIKSISTKICLVDPDAKLVVLDQVIPDRKLIVCNKILPRQTWPKFGHVRSSPPRLKFIRNWSSVPHPDSAKFDKAGHAQKFGRI